MKWRSEERTQQTRRQRRQLRRRELGARRSCASDGGSSSSSPATAAGAAVQCGVCSGMCWLFSPTTGTAARCLLSRFTTGPPKRQWQQTSSGREQVCVTGAGTKTRISACIAWHGHAVPIEKIESRERHRPGACRCHKQPAFVVCFVDCLRPRLEFWM